MNSNDKKVLKVLKAINKIKKLTQEQCNRIILKEYPNYEDSSKVLLTVFLKDQLKKVESASLEAIFDEIDPIVPKLYTNVSTQDNYMTQNVRGIISKRFGIASREHELVKQLVALPDDVKGKLLIQQKKKAKDATVDKIELDPDRFIKIIKDNLNSTDAFKKSIALLLASGVRPFELYHLSNFSVENLWIRQERIAKKKTRVDSSFVVKPALYITAQEFVDGVKDIRKKINAKYDVTTEDKMTSSVMSRANEAAKEIFGNQKSLTQRSCRPIYGILSYEEIGRFSNRHGNTLSINEWISEVLGHDNLGTSINYRKFIIKGKPKSKEEEQRIKEHNAGTRINVNNSQNIVTNSILENKIEDLEERLDNLKISKTESVPIGFKIGDTEVKDKLVKLEAEFNRIKSTGQKPRSFMLEQYAKKVKISRAFTRLFFKKQAYLAVI